MLETETETGASEQQQDKATTGYELTTGWYVAIVITLFVFAVLVLSCKNSGSAEPKREENAALARM